MMNRLKASALIIVDMINALDFPEGKAVLKGGIVAARRIARLRRQFKTKGSPVIYANDNHGQWRSDLRQIVERCSRADSLGAALVAEIRPEADDYFVLKPRHSAFFETPLDNLLKDLRCASLLIGGLTAEGCVLATALDAHVRGYRVRVPSNCIASSTLARKTAALTVLRSLKLDTRAV